MIEMVHAEVREDEFTARTARVSIGAVVPHDEVLDDEYWTWSPPEVAWHFTRTPWREEKVGVDGAQAVSEGTMLTSTVLPLVGIGAEVVAYCCTSGSFVDGTAGDAAIVTAMEQGGVRQAITTSAAIVQAVRALGCTAPAVVAPYDAPTTARLVEFLTAEGFVVPAAGYYGLNARVEEVSESATLRLALEIGADPVADCVVISCTNLRTYAMIGALEEQLGKPVVTANQATVWASLRAAGVSLPSHGQTLFP